MIVGLFQTFIFSIFIVIPHENKTTKRFEIFKQKFFFSSQVFVILSQASDSIVWRMGIFIL